MTLSEPGPGVSVGSAVPSATVPVQLTAPEHAKSATTVSPGRYTALSAGVRIVTPGGVTSTVNLRLAVARGSSWVAFSV